MLKSLKECFTKKSILDKVSQWSGRDCLDYLKKHSEDRLQSPLQKVKLKIVEQSFEKFLRDRKTRRQTFSGINPPLDSLKPYVPRQATDPKPNVWKLQPYQKNTGIYLWTKGYDVERFLGAGGFGVVWECNGKALKVTCGGKGAIDEEIISVQKLQELFEKDETGKAKKYLNSIKHKGGNIFKALLASGDMLEEVKDEKKNGKTIESVLRNAKIALKAVKIMHDAGYSHNDIKPENFLKLSNYHNEVERRQKQEKKTAEGKKLHKNRIQLGDFGIMTEIQNTPPGKAGSRGYMAPDVENASPEAVEKRDVYSLGVTFIFFLMSKYDTTEVVKDLFYTTPEEVYDAYKLKELYGGTSKENVVAFLSVIKKMIQKTFSNRISVDEALGQIRALKGGQ